MKRWQVRGEVQDSEDDQISLSSQSPSPERPRKRQKIFQDSETDGGAISALAKSEDSKAIQEDDEAAWLRPNAVRTYGKKRSLRPQSSLPKEREPSAAATSPTLEEAAPVSANQPTTVEEYVAITPLRSPGSQHRLLWKGTVHQSSTQDVDLPFWTANSVLAPRVEDPSLSEQHSLSDSESLPDLKVLIARQTTENSPKNGLALLLSSPLSEREVSPPVGFDLAPQRIGSNSPPRSVDSSNAQVVVDRIVVDIDDDELPTSTVYERRSLRNRKPEQVNPYQYDRLRYQRQCRERGLRPIRLTEQQAANQESQDSSQYSQPQNIDNAPPSSDSLSWPETIPTSTRAAQQFGRFNVLEDSSDTKPRSAHHLTKRRKLDDGSRTLDINRAVASTASFTPEMFPVPPSPPTTSSEPHAAVETGLSSSSPIRSTFRWPPGLTPAPLPTPEISSDIRHGVSSQDSKTDSPPRTSRSSTAARRRRQLSYSSISSDSDEATKFEAERLARERKRIKGVLPASWLKIDFRAQRAQRSPSPVTSRQNSASPRQKEVQKGVARRIVSTRANAEDSGGLQLSDLSAAELEPSVQISSPVQREQANPAHTHHGLDLMAGDEADDDLMEADFVDPMLATGSSRRRNVKHSHTRQPRVTEAFQTSTFRSTDFAGEPIRRRKTVERKGRGDRPNKSNQGRRSGGKRLPLMSIADVPLSPRTEGDGPPQFVRLALRRTRQDPDRGRHSPTNKVIRLATHDDTADATTLLRTWREGTLVPLNTERIETTGGQLAGRRIPLVDIHGNTRQQMFSPPVRTQRGQARNTYPTSGSAPTSTTRKPRMMQRKLQPSILPTQRQTDEGHARNPPPTETPLRLSHWPPTQHPPRGAQLETLEQEFDQEHRAAVFERRMQCLTENFAVPWHKQRSARLPLEKFLGPDSVKCRSQPISQRRSWKAHAKRINVEESKFLEVSDGSSDIPFPNAQTEDTATISMPVLQGFGSFGTRFPVDFDAQPLAVVNPFDPSTFIGSGEFDDALSLSERDLHAETGRIRVHLDGEVLEWGPWTEEVAAKFSRILTSIMDALQLLDQSANEADAHEQRRLVNHTVDYLLRSLVRYLSKCLYFVDPIDRQSCIQSVHSLVTALLDLVAEHPSLSITILVLQYGRVLVDQALQLCHHSSIPANLETQINELCQRSAVSLGRHIVLNGTTDLHSFYAKLRRTSDQQHSNQQDLVKLGSIAVLHHTSLTARGPCTFWQAVAGALDIQADTLCALADFERAWRLLFTMLPALQINRVGSVQNRPESFEVQEGWNMVEPLVRRVLTLYVPSSRIRGYTVNDYVRALFARCHCLVHKWSWRRCESILNSMYDFFAHRNLGLLHNEDSRGSPRFLEDFQDDAAFEVLPDDRSFHIFLKLLATGLWGMRKHEIYKDSKITGIAWRFIPNHSRSCKNDVGLERSEVEALRNHYDLLCTLYCSMPPGYRISVETPRNLVDQATSHREACRLSVRAWANITTFQLATTEGVDPIQPLADWFAEILRVNISQYRVARQEAEQAKKDAEVEGVLVSMAHVDRTVAGNQQEVIKIIVDVLAGLRRALSSASNLQQAEALIQKTGFWSVFDLFDPKQQRLVGALMEGLQVVTTVIDVDQRHSCLPNILGEVSDESQEYGDLDALEEFVAAERSGVILSSTITSDLLTAVGHFVSNVFGADAAGDDALLQRTIDVWTNLAKLTTLRNQSHWGDYVNDYGKMSWSQMRDTLQKRKFTTYYMSQIVQQSKGDREVTRCALNTWLLSLVEREALLKYQHLLTATLLNSYPHEPLLSNLPFVKDGRTDTYVVALHDLRQRRLSLLSSVFSNMRKHLEDVELFRPSEKSDVQSQYGGMLRKLMQVMKDNYQELQTSTQTDVADHNIQGAYVEFVQHVISFLQQHAGDICKIDRFFMDSSAFPLPASDPTYVVGRLRSYVPKLHESNRRAQLAALIQSVSERAAADGQQQYLVSQLATSMKNTPEQGDPTSPTLRHVILGSIVPIYIEQALSSACAWILVLPMLEASGEVISDLLYNVQIEEEASMLVTIDVLTAMLHSIHVQCQHVAAHPALLELPYIARISRAMFDVVKMCLPLTSLIVRSVLRSNELVSNLAALNSFAFAMAAHLGDSNGTQVEDIPSRKPLALTGPWQDTRSFVEREIRKGINGWEVVGGQYIMRKHNITKVVPVDLGTSAAEKSSLLLALKDFERAHEMTFERRMVRFAEDDDLVGDVVV